MPPADVTPHAGEWTAIIKTCALPFLGETPMSEVSTNHFLAAIEPIWMTKAEAYSRLRGRIENLVHHAKPRG